MKSSTTKVISTKNHQPQADLPEDSCTCDFRLPYNPGSTCHVPGRYNMRNADPLAWNSDVPSDSMFKSKDLHDLSIVDSVTTTGFWWEYMERSMDWIIESCNSSFSKLEMNRFKAEALFSGTDTVPENFWAWAQQYLECTIGFILDDCLFVGLFYPVNSCFVPKDNGIHLHLSCTCVCNLYPRDKKMETTPCGRQFSMTFLGNATSKEEPPLLGNQYRARTWNFGPSKHGLFFWSFRVTESFL